MSSNQTQDQVAQGAIYKYIDIQAGIVTSMRVKYRTLLFCEEDVNNSR